MSSLVVAIAHRPEHQAILEPICQEIEPGDEWSVGDRHVVAARLTFAPAVLARVELPEGFTCDLNCRDDTAKAAWGDQPYDLFAASGSWTEETGLQVIEGLTSWLREFLPEPTLFQAGLDTAGVSLVLLPENGVRWTITERHE